MKYSVCLVLLLTACANTGDPLVDYSYGPAEWTADHWGWKIDTITPGYYEKLRTPETIEVTYHSDMETFEKACGPYAKHKRGCHRKIGPISLIDIRERSNPSVLAHELKHAYGWCHYKIDYRGMWNMTPEEKQREIDRAQGWYPCDKRSEA